MKYNIGDKLMCKTISMTGNGHILGFTVGKTYIIDDISPDCVSILDNFEQLWDFDLNAETSYFAVDNYFFNIKEIRKKKLKEIEKNNN